ncbi:phage tail tip fiber protein [Sphingomonas sp. Leaf257]|uniref:phage tail tip fiber protein n=1 Tax=Sphingomonas sp. Leaf257 TaxID=1736309 RepID=UPI0006FE0AAD|nr:DUF1983 domain-containing protein [Sphingomonas sp. Leaf257]KQO58840.1 hypothetical protein ASF14_02725 [Sphingomonas sp. Leaf257]
MKTVIVEARPSDATGQPVDIRLAGGGRTHYLFKGQSDWRAGVISVPRIESALGFGKDGFTGGAVAQASAIGFSPAMAATRAPIAGLVWNDAPITVSVADDEAADPGFKVRLAGTVAGYSVSAGRFVFTLSDMAGRLGEPLVKDSFAGTGGIEGDAAAKGRVKRRSWGRCWNVEGRVLLAAWNIYEFGDPARALSAFDAVKDKGRPVAIVTVAWAGSVAATLDALKAASVPEGGCAAAPSIACVKFWTQPSTLTADLRGELGTGYVEHVPGIAAAISAAAEGPVVDGLAAIAALRPDPAGLHADDASETPAQMLDRLCLRASLSWGVTADKRIALRPIAFADPVETVVFEDVERRAAYAPIANVKVGWQKNHRVHTDAEISAAVLAGDVAFGDGSTLDKLATTLTDGVQKAVDKADAVTANLVGRRLTGLLQSAIDGQAALNIDYGSAAISAASALASQNLVAIQTLGTRIEKDGSKVAESFQQLTSRLDENEKKVAGINVKGEVEAGMTQLRRTIANANFASFEAVDKRIANFGEAVSAWQVKEEKARVDANSAVIKSVDDIGARVTQEGLDRQASIKDLREVLIDKDGNLIAQRIQNLGTRVTVILNGETVTLESAIQTVDKSYRTATGTVAESVKTLTARLDNVGDATLEQSMKAVADKIKGLSAEYTLKVQTTQGGKKYVAGMGIAIDNGVSAIAFSTDAFTIALPDETEKQLFHADKDGVYMPDVRVDRFKVKSIDTPALADYAIRRSYSAELAGNVALPNSDGGRSRYLTLGVTKQLADSSIRIECNMAPRPGRDYAGYFVFGRTTDGADTVIDTKWYWVTACVINGFRSVRLPFNYGRAFAGLPAGSHSFWIDFVAYGGGNDQGFMEAGSNFYVEEIKV